MADRVVINPVTRIEGHARIVLDLDDTGQVGSGHLEVLEIRGFEKLLQGMELFKMPQITARLCGVCPGAHHLAAVIAIENGLGVAVPRDARLLRELLYVGHALHSHALSTFVLTGPDMLVGIDAEAAMRSILSMLQLDSEMAKKVLRVRSIGQRVVEIVGGRGVHPVTAVPGGMAARPAPDQLEVIAGWGQEALQLLEEVGTKLCEKLLPFDDLKPVTELPFHSLALSRDGHHTMLDGTWVVLDAEGNQERSFRSADYGEHLIEHVMPGSYMKSVRLRGETEKYFFVGPLARLNVNQHISTAKAGKALAAFRGNGKPRLAALDQIGARLVEMFHFAERMTEIAGNELGNGPLRNQTAAASAGRFIGAIEAPRGILVHDYTSDDSGRVTDVNFIVATQNNYHAIDHAITGAARHFMPQQNDELLMNGVEFALRCFDPCLACATHAAGRMALEIEIRQHGEVIRRVCRGRRSRQ
jgi:F420-non-reducing hydrogenase large subunit